MKLNRDIVNYMFEKMSQRLWRFSHRYEMGFKKYERLMSKEDTHKDEVELGNKEYKGSHVILYLWLMFFVFNTTGR